MKKYSDIFCKWLKEAGYTHCFTLGGGNIMHLTESASNYFKIVPVINEVAAVIGAEYFNECETDKKAFVLVTTGPGVTNTITGIAGAFLESRELLVIGGQVKVENLQSGGVRQIGIQELDTISLTKSIVKASLQITKPITKKELFDLIKVSRTPRKGPVFIDFPIDVQAAKVEEKEENISIALRETFKFAPEKEIENVANLIKNSKRPSILLGAGISRKLNLIPILEKLGTIPVFTTWNALDRIDSSHELYFGRPNTWGMRYSNILLSQSDLIISLGSRLGLQQTGFNYQEFAPNAKIVQVEADAPELEKNLRKIDFKILGDANNFLETLASKELGNHKEWLDFCKMVKVELPLNEEWANKKPDEGFISPFSFVEGISKILTKNDNYITCSSGGAYTVNMQTFQPKLGQVTISNKALASMGYGLSGAIGTCFAFPERRTILVEGDGGFGQNLQELGTVKVNKLNLKMFIFFDNGYASIRQTQKNYFNGKYVGCDENTGVGMPNWKDLAKAYDIPFMNFTNFEDLDFLKLFNSNSPSLFIVHIDPNQTYFPKIASKVLPNGSMASNPIHFMSPELPPEISQKVFKYL